MKLAFPSIVLVLAVAPVTLCAQMVTVQDGTPVRLRLERAVSSATAHVGEMIDFEVTEPVVVQDVVVIPKGSLAFGHVSKVEPKRRFARAGELEITVDSVRLSDGATATLRATRDEGNTGLHGARLAATIATSPLLVWVKGKNVEFERGLETTAYVRGETHLQPAQLRQNRAAAGQQPPPALASGGNGEVLTNRDITQMKKAGLSDDVISTKIQTSESNFHTAAQDLIDLKAAGVSEQIIQEIIQKAATR